MSQNLKNFNLNIARNEQHPFHLVKASKWPLVLSIVLFSFVFQVVAYFYSMASYVWVVFQLAALCFVLFRWFREVIWESYWGYHTKKVQAGIRLGMILFIVSEVMFFFSFFWAYFHSSLSPAVMIGFSWPMQGINPIDFTIPTVNTLILLSSGISVTVVHKLFSMSTFCEAGYEEKIRYSSAFMVLTILYALIFSYIQLWEYKTLPFSINDGIYGSLFFMLTGFHGFHVIVGTIFLFIMLIRMVRYQFSDTYIGLDCAIWYWHFVDVVWLFLWLVVYYDTYPPVY